MHNFYRFCGNFKSKWELSRKGILERKSVELLWKIDKIYINVLFSYILSEFKHRVFDIHTTQYHLFVFIVRAYSTHETHSSRNKCCGGDENPYVARPFCTNSPGVQISRWYDSYNIVKVIQAYLRYESNLSIYFEIGVASRITFSKYCILNLASPSVTRATHEPRNDFCQPSFTSTRSQRITLWWWAAHTPPKYCFEWNVACAYSFNNRCYINDLLQGKQIIIKWCSFACSKSNLLLFIIGERDSAVYYYSRNYIMGEFINLWNFMYWTWEIFHLKQKYCCCGEKNYTHRAVSQQSHNQMSTEKHVVIYFDGCCYIS